MTVFVVDDFRRWIRRQVLGDDDLCAAVAEMARGLIDADLGHGLLKKRVARSGAGKRGGYRVIVASRRRTPWFFLCGYAKSQRAALSPTDLAHARRLSDDLLSMTADGLRKALGRGDISEVHCHDEATVEVSGQRAGHDPKVDGSRAHLP